MATAQLAADAEAEPALLGATVEASGGYRGAWSTSEDVGLTSTGGLVDLGARLGIRGDGTYGPDIANFRGRQSLAGQYLLLEEGWVRVQSGAFSALGGRVPQADAFVSPYSLFLSSRHPALNGAWYRWDDGRFTFENRWIELNRDSSFVDHNASPNDFSSVPPAWRTAGAEGFPDRGADLKTLTFRAGSLRLGIQDAAVYTRRSFDSEYFLSPMPAYFTQYVKSTAGRPWSTSSNENNLIGGFAEWSQPDLWVGAQVLVDDFSLHFLLPRQVPNNPWKVAANLGFISKKSTSSWGFHVAGATKYTFEPYSSLPGQESRTAYGYTLYPDVQYVVDGQWRALSIENNALGYLHGENNVAFMATFDTTPDPHLRWGQSLEYVAAGSNSPANPWHDGVGAREYGTQWLNDRRLAHTLTWSSQLTWTEGDWEWFASVEASRWWNKLGLRSPTTAASSDVSPLDSVMKIFSPSGTTSVGGSFAIGGRWKADLSSWFWGPAHE